MARSMESSTQSLPPSKPDGHGDWKPATPESMSDMHIIDVRTNAAANLLDLKNEITSMLNPSHGQKMMPTLLLYNEKGLQIFEKITYLDEYYLTNAEIDVLTRNAIEIASHIPSDSMLVELGSGNLRKISILLNALEKAEKDIDYYALDLSREELERTLADVPRFRFVRCHGLNGTYEDGLAWLKAGRNAARPKCILSLGSSIGNFGRTDAATFLRTFSTILGPNDTMLIGLDATYDGPKVFHAYNDREGLTHKFVLNGLEHANDVLGEPVFNLQDWTVIGEFVVDAEGGKHRAFYAPKRDLEVCGVPIKSGERVQVEQSLKFSRAESHTLFRQANLTEIEQWTATDDDYNVHLLVRSPAEFSLLPEQYAGTTVPTLEDWRGLWATWDTVTRGMIPHEDLLEKPIKLRNACIFYLGHIPTFLDLQLEKATGESICEPKWFAQVFERGIDPDVDNPELCHAHSEIPDEWPQLDEILAHQHRVRAKIQRMYEAGGMTRKIARSVWMGFEHEVMHLETLLYMLLQSDRTLPPPRTPRPDFVALAKMDVSRAVPNKWHAIPESRISIGQDDPEDNSSDGNFGWDNEKPRREATVPAFEARGRGITNEEYAAYLEATNKTSLPASWTTIPTSSDSTATPFHANKAVRTVYGPVPLNLALHWPVFASYDELAGCATYMGGRIPTADETRSLYEYAEIQKRKGALQKLTASVPAVNGHLIANGVQESPPSGEAVKGDVPTTTNSQVNEHEKDSSITTPNPETDTSTHMADDRTTTLFTDLTACNIGFRNWHPTAITSLGTAYPTGRGASGGVWEWTSTVLAPHAGFEPMPLYEAYTSDFFDGKHNVVLGGSWATHPRVAGRKSFVNWYQRNYPYAWCGARVVRDLPV